MPDLNVLFPENAPKKWSWMISEEELNYEEEDENEDEKEGEKKK